MVFEKKKFTRIESKEIPTVEVQVKKEVMEEAKSEEKKRFKWLGGELYFDREKEEIYTIGVLFEELLNSL